MSISNEVCQRCGHDFCSECLVYPFGAHKGAMCIACALEAGGVSRQKTGRPRLSRKEVRQRVAHSPPTVEQATAPEPAGEAPGTDDEDLAWLYGDVDPEALGGWSRRF